MCRPRSNAVDPFHLPLINTLILLLSGCAVTWAHHALVHGGPRKDVANGLIIGRRLGLKSSPRFRPSNTGELIAHYGWSFSG